MARLGLARSVGAQHWQPWFRLVCAWLLINISVNATFPAKGAFLHWCLPSLEATIIVACFAGCVSMGWRVRGWQYVSIASILLMLRALRLVDGCYVRYFHRPFRAAVDLPLLPESVRLLVQTDGIASALMVVGLLLSAAVLLFWLLKRALVEIERSLTSLLTRRAGMLGAAAVSNLKGGALIGAIGLVPLTLLAQSNERQSASARLVAEIDFLLNFSDIRQEAFARFSRVSSELARTPHNLMALKGRDVTLILIESYGRGALDTSAHANPMQHALEKFEQRLARKGVSAASAWLLAPSYGGGSWYAHATLSTGVKVWSPLNYELLLDSELVSLSRYMARAGYHTVNVMPGTTRVWPQEKFYGFDEKLYARDFEYAGPWFNWGRFPDQYVLDQVRRKFADASPQLYKEIKLVSSHVPWREVPAVVDDWDQIQDGALYHELPTQRFPMKWSNLKDAHWPYLATIIYDLEVVGRYVEQFENEASLVIVMGDHQPVRQASRSDQWDVPIHVLGPRDLVDRFIGQGFEPGLKPADAAEPLPMERFLPLFLSVLSEAES